MSANHSIKKLLDFSKAIGIKVTLGDECIWYPHLNRIKLDKDLEGHELLSSLLHELGHVIEDLSSDFTCSEVMYKAYKNVYKNKSTRYQLSLVIKHERKAWYVGRQLARQLKINLGKWYDEDEKNCIASYRCS